jgi:YHS domain-containing protein
MNARLRTAVAVALLSVPACAKAGATAAPSEPGAAAPAPAATVVPNLEAKPGDTTTCPFSGRTFVVAADHPQVEYQGKTYWICSENAAEQVRADPGKYLDDFAG